MKQFDLEKALAGEPVVTRDGRPVKIAGYNPDAKTDYQVSGWVEGFATSWCANGRFREKHEHNDCDDLFMAPKERKEWVVRLEKGGKIVIWGPYKDLGYVNNAFSCEIDNGATVHEITIHE